MNFTVRRIVGVCMLLAIGLTALGDEEAQGPSCADRIDLALLDD